MNRRDNVFVAIGLFLLPVVSLQAEPNPVVKAEKANIIFTANVNASDWVEDESQLSWAVALTDQNIVKAISQHQGKTYNQPTLSITELNSHLIIKGIDNGVRENIEIVAGNYDWIILVDIDGDDLPDSYIGSMADEIQFDQHLFEANRSYYVEVDSDGRIQYRVE